MKLSGFCSIVLTVATFCTAISQNCVLAYNDTNETDMLIQSQSYSAETIPLAEFKNEDSIAAYLSEHNTCSYESEITHMYDGAMKFSSEANGEQSYMRMEGLSIDFSKAEYSDYEYLNFWMYVPEVLPTNNDGEPSELSVILRTSAGTNVKAFYYNLPVAESGWNLVSIPRSDMKNKSAAADWTTTSEIVELLFYMNPKKAVLPDVKGWPEDGSGYVLVDYMYLSKNMPDMSNLNFVQTSIENGADNVDEYLGNDKTVEFTANTGLLESGLNADKCTVRENDTVMPDGYRVYVEENKIKVTFNDTPKASSKYSITFDEGIVYSQYGMTTDAAYSLEFSIASASSVYRIDNSFPENGTENVPLDIDGNNTVTLTMNNEPGNTDDLKNNIRVIKNNSVINSGYSINIDDKNIYVKFDNKLEANGKYTIKLPDYAEDIYGNTISGDMSIVFYTEQNSDNVATLLSMGDPNTYSDINFNDMVYKEAEHARIYEETLHYTIPAVNTFDFYLPVKTDMSQYKYLNLWLYSPEIANSGFTITGWDNSGGYFRAHKVVDWSGWQLITLNIADFATGGSGTPSWKDVTSIGISVNGWTGYISPWSKESYLCIDDVFLSKVNMDEPKMLGTSLPANYQNAPIFDFNVDFICSNVLGGVNKSLVKIYDEDNNEIENFDADTIGSKLNININQNLNYNTMYKIVLQGNSIYDKTGAQISQDITYTFKTTSPDISVGIPVFKQDDNIISSIPASSSEIMASVLVSNDGTENNNVVLTAVQYDAEGNTIDIQKQQKTIPSGESSNILNCMLNVKDETAKIAAFICDNNMKPLRRETAYLNGKDNIVRVYADSESASSNLRIDNAEISVRELSVTGTYNGAGTVLVRITDSKGNDIHLDILSADENKCFGTICNLDKDSEEGQYTVTISAFDAASVSKNVIYLSDETREEILNEVNMATGVGEMSKIVSKYKSLLQIEELPQTRISNISRTLYEQKTYKTYNKLLETIKNADVLLERLNKLQWSELTAFLSANKNIVMYGENTYDYYNSLSNEKKNAINTVIVKSLPQTDFSGFRSVFAAAVDDYKKNQSQGGTTGGSGSSSGGGTGTHVGSIGGIKNIVVPPVIDNNATNETNQGVIDNTQFSDMDNYSWAKAYVNNLLDRNIISMPDDKRFRPGDNITREEYVKMIVAAFDIPIGEHECKYIDAVNGAWYQPYLAAATEAGIIEGNDDGSFGVGNPITRQDMAVIAYRAVSLTDKSLTIKNEAIVFDDNDSISDYAITAVSEMSAAGIIVGMGNSKFEPLVNAQRAQAAKVISDLVYWRDNI